MKLILVLLLALQVWLASAGTVVTPKPAASTAAPPGGTTTPQSSEDNSGETTPAPKRPDSPEAALKKQLKDAAHEGNGGTLSLLNGDNNGDFTGTISGNSIGNWNTPKKAK